MENRRLTQETSNYSSELDIQQSLRESELAVQITKRKEVKKRLKELVQRLEIVKLKIQSGISVHEFDLLDIQSKLLHIQKYWWFCVHYTLF